MLSPRTIASRLKRPFDALSNESASDSGSKPAIHPGLIRKALTVIRKQLPGRSVRRELQALELSCLDVASQVYGVLPGRLAGPEWDSDETSQLPAISHHLGAMGVPLGAPKLDEARDLSSPLSEPIQGMFPDIDTLTSLDHKVSEPEQAASCLADERCSMHPGDHRAYQYCTSRLVEEHELPRTRRDYAHHEFGTDPDTLSYDAPLIPAHLLHSTFYGVDDSVLTSHSQAIEPHHLGPRRKTWEQPAQHQSTRAVSPVSYPQAHDWTRSSDNRALRMRELQEKESCRDICEDTGVSD